MRPFGRPDDGARASITAGEAAWQLGHREGGALTQYLSDLYEYSTCRLVHANLHGDSAAVGKVLGLLGGIRAASASIGSQMTPRVAVSSVGGRRG
jgi:flagellin-specific chaperone FliS